MFTSQVESWAQASEPECGQNNRCSPRPTQCSRLRQRRSTRYIVSTFIWEPFDSGEGFGCAASLLRPTPSSEGARAPLPFRDASLWPARIDVGERAVSDATRGSRAVQPATTVNALTHHTASDGLLLHGADLQLFGRADKGGSVLEGGAAALLLPVAGLLGVAVALDGHAQTLKPGCVAPASVLLRRPAVATGRVRERRAKRDGRIGSRWWRRRRRTEVELLLDAAVRFGYSNLPAVAATVTRRAGVGKAAEGDRVMAWARTWRVGVQKRRLERLRVVDGGGVGGGQHA